MLLNVTKTKEMVVNLKRKRPDPSIWDTCSDDESDFQIVKVRVSYMWLSSAVFSTLEIKSDIWPVSQ